MTRKGFVLSVALVSCQGSVSVEGGLPSDTETREGMALDGALRITRGGDQLVIEEARILLSELEIEGRTEASEFSVGPEALDLGLDGRATEIAFAAVSAGTYEEIALELARGGTVSGAAADGFGADDSIVVTGSFGGEAFTYRSGYAPELEFGLDGLRVTDGETAVVTVTFDVASWFLDPDGNLLDPSDPANHDAIEAAIARSVAAHVEDEDEDDDDGAQDDD
jgi:hypothetical protein